MAGWLRVALTVAPVVPGLALVWSTVRSYRRCDEFVQHSILQAAALTALVTAVWTFALRSCSRWACRCCPWPSSTPSVAGLHLADDPRDSDLRVKTIFPQLRAERGWTQAELAARLSVSRQTIIAIETGRYDPSLPLAFAIGREFSLPVENIFSEERKR